jgi:hypothetical protein
LGRLSASILTGTARLLASVENFVKITEQTARLRGLQVGD